MTIRSVVFLVLLGSLALGKPVTSNGMSNTQTPITIADRSDPAPDPYAPVPVSIADGSDPAPDPFAPVPAVNVTV
jgi:hypothetical protein